MKKFFLSSALACCTLTSFAQRTITGRVVENPTGEGLAYVSLGIPGTSIGKVVGSKHFYKYGSRNRWKSFAGMSAAMLLDVRQ